MMILTDRLSHTEFCVFFSCQETINQVLTQQPITDQANLTKLKEYGYLIHDEQGNWKLRVPLLDMWLREYRHAV